MYRKKIASPSFYRSDATGQKQVGGFSMYRGDDLLVVDGKVVRASFLASCKRLGKVKGAGSVRRLNRAERRRLAAHGFG